MMILKLGFVRNYITIVARGICSSGLCYLVNLCYREMGRQLILINKGVTIPIFNT